MLLLLTREAADTGIQGHALYYLMESESSIPARIRQGELFRTRFSSHPLYAKAILLLARSYTDAGDRNRALRILEDSLSRDTDGALRFELSRVQISLGAFRIALGHLRRLEKRRGGFSDPGGVAYCSGYANFCLKRYSEALGYFNQVVGRYRGSRWEASSVFHLGEIANARKRIVEAGRWYRRVLELYPNSLSALSARSRLLLISRYSPERKKVEVFEIQLAAYTYRKYALRYVRVLQQKGITSFIRSDVRAGRKWYSVRVGYFRIRRKAEEVLRSLNRRSIKGFIRSRTVELSEG